MLSANWEPPSGLLIASAYRSLQEAEPLTGPAEVGRRLMSGGGKYGEVMNKEMKLSSKVRGRSMASPDPHANHNESACMV